MRTFSRALQIIPISPLDLALMRAYGTIRDNNIHISLSPPVSIAIASLRLNPFIFGLLPSAMFWAEEIISADERSAKALNRRKVSRLRVLRCGLAAFTHSAVCPSAPSAGVC